MSEDLIRRYRERYPEGQDSSGIESNPACARCGHSRGHHEIRAADRPFGYCVQVECDCTNYQEATS